MSITVELAQEYADEYAVVCCRLEAGTAIEPAVLEDPAIIPDLVESKLLEIPANCLRIGEVLSAELKVNVPALTPLTEELLVGVKVKTSEKQKQDKQDKLSDVGTNFISIHIGEGKDINLKIPAGLFPVTADQKAAPGKDPEEKFAGKIVRTLVRKHFKIDKVQFAAETKIIGTTLYLRDSIGQEAAAAEELVTGVQVDIITPDRYGEYSETIMDIQPIATKEEGNIGEGITRVINGVIVMVTGIDEDGVQMGEFGSSEGAMDKKIMWGRPGSPDKGEIFIKARVVIQSGKGMERPGPMAIHRATDVVVQEIREALKKAEESLVVKREELVQKRYANRKKVIIVKEIMGQGAMHDNYIFPMEPAGTSGAKANVDLGNIPVVVSPLQVLDGCVHALTCVGPASKETTRHYWREPLVLEMMQDEELDLAAVIFIGSPQINAEKFYVSRLLGMTIEAMDIEGAIVTTEGFGNNHIDFASHIEEIGKRGIPVVGVTYSAVQGQLVIGNKYMDAMIDTNKSVQGIENEILQNNCLAPEDAIRAVYMLKAKMAGEEIKKPARKWTPAVKFKNIATITEATGREIPLELNETSLHFGKGEV